MDDPTPNDSPEPRRATDGIADAIARSYEVATPDPAFMGRVGERLLEASARRRANASRRRLIAIGAGAAAAAVIVAAVVTMRAPGTSSPPAEVVRTSPAVVEDLRAPVVAETQRALLAESMLQGREWVFARRDPYVVAQEWEPFRDPAESHKNAARRATAEVLAQSDAAVLEATYERFHEMFGGPLGLPRLEARGDVLVDLVTWNRDGLESAWQETHGPGLTAAVRAFYAPSSRRIFRYAGEASMRSQDEVLCAGGRIQKQSHQVTAHEALHQLMHAYGDRARDAQAAKLPTPLWLGEGLAEYFGGIEAPAENRGAPEAAAITHGRVRLDLVALCRGDGGTGRRGEAKAWTIRKLVDVASFAGIGEMQATPERRGVSPQAHVFYARSWGLVHFLWHYDGGVHRDRLVSLLRAALRGDLDADGFARNAGLTTPAEWDQLEAQFEWYWDRLLARDPRPAPGGDPRRAPATDPPTGPMTK